jgi:hypothetical protein
LTIVDVCSTVSKKIDFEETTRMNTMPLDPLAASVHAHIEQLRREADTHRLARNARGPRRAYTWPAGITAALRDSVAAAFSRPARATAAHRSSTTCCV